MHPQPFVPGEERGGLSESHAQQGRPAIGMNTNIMVLRLQGVDHRSAQFQGQPGVEPGRSDPYRDGRPCKACRKACLNERHDSEHAGRHSSEALKRKLAAEEPDADREGCHGQRAGREYGRHGTRSDLRPGRPKPSDAEANQIATGDRHSCHNEPVADPRAQARSLSVQRADSGKGERERERSKRKVERPRRERRFEGCPVHDTAGPFTTFGGVSHGPCAI